MPTACVPKHYCGTHAPGWLSGSHPTKIGQVVNGKVCFHWGSNCCNWNAAIQIKKCNGFYVYKLTRTPVCWLRYCGNSGFGKFSIYPPSYSERNKRKIHLNDIYIHIYLHFSQTHVKQAGLAKMEPPV